MGISTDLELCGKKSQVGLENKFGDVSLVDASRFKECTRVADSHRMSKMSDGELCERSIMLHFAPEILPDRVFLDYSSSLLGLREGYIMRTQQREKIFQKEEQIR